QGTRGEDGQDRQGGIGCRHAAPVRQGQNPVGRLHETKPPRRYPHRGGLICASTAPVPRQCTAPVCLPIPLQTPTQRRRATKPPPGASFLPPQGRRRKVTTHPAPLEKQRNAQSLGLMTSCPKHCTGVSVGTSGITSWPRRS